ncbi:unnamed protein product [Miscanthus lutarioriparius]|uniref:Uncharacterized protein n=1 Tax=Miscanthus lutarioriparius TaxID=422564 RepID=A0A811R7L2_9POAL|nr:unnamed protein product [Miscanthus lutarioriparius]
MAPGWPELPRPRGTGPGSLGPSLAPGWPRPEQAGPLRSHPAYAGIAGASGAPTHAGMAGAPRSHGREAAVVGGGDESAVHGFASIRDGPILRRNR